MGYSVGILVAMRRAHLALAVLVAAIWGLNFVVIEVGLEDFPPLLLSELRYALASLPLLVLGGMPSVRCRWVLAVGIAIGVVKFSLLFIGMDVGMPAGLASLELQAQALFTVVLAAVLLRERIAGSQVLGLAIAFGGLALVAGGLDGVATAEGFALVIAAAVAWGFGNLALKRAAPSDPLRFMTTVCVVPPIPLLALSLAFEGPAEIGDAFAGADALGIGAVLYLAFVATTVGWGLWGALMARYPASTVAPFALLVPVFGLSFGALLLGEPITGRDVAAAALILAGVMLTLRAPRMAISPLVAESRSREACIPAAAARE